MSRVFIDKPPNGRKYHHDAAIDNRQFHENHAMSCPAVVDRKPVNEKQQQQKAFHYWKWNRWECHELIMQ